jgi:hypothetical protein
LEFFPKIQRQTEKARRRPEIALVEPRDVISWIDGDRICFFQLSQQELEQPEQESDSSSGEEPVYENVPEELRQARLLPEFVRADGDSKPVSDVTFVQKSPIRIDTIKFLSIEQTKLFELSDRTLSVDNLISPKQMHDTFLQSIFYQFVSFGCLSM